MKGSTAPSVDARLLDRAGERFVARLIVPLGLALLVAVLWFARFNPITGFTPPTDSGAYLYIGQQMLRGGVPYVDVFDNKGPLLYFVNAVGLVLGRGSFWGVYVLEAALLALVAIATYRLLRGRVGRLIAAVAAAAFVLMATRLAVGNHEEEYAVVLQCVTLVLLLRRRALETRGWCWFVAGVVASGALFLKPTGLGLWIALVLATFMLSAGAGRWRFWSRRVLWGIAGLALGSAAFLLSLAASGALGAFVDDYLVFNVAYSRGNGLGDRLSSVAYGMHRLGLLVCAVTLIVWLLTLARMRRQRSERDSTDALALLALVWLPVEVLLSATSGYSRVQYYFPWVLPITVLFAYGLREVLDRRWVRPAGNRRLLGWAAVGTLVALALVGLAPSTLQSLHELAGSVLHYRSHVSRTPAAEQLADYVRSHTGPDDYVLVWGGYDASVNLLSARRSPTCYVMQLALYHSSYAAEGLPRFLADLEAHPPALILDSSPSYGDAWGTAVPSIDSGGTPASAVSEDVVEDWAAVSAFLAAKYRRDGTVGPESWPVYVRR